MIFRSIWECDNLENYFPLKILKIIPEPKWIFILQFKNDLNICVLPINRFTWNYLYFTLLKIDTWLMILRLWPLIFWLPQSLVESIQIRLITSVLNFFLSDKCTSVLNIDKIKMKNQRERNYYNDIFEYRRPSASFEVTILHSHYLSKLLLKK